MCCRSSLTSASYACSARSLFFQASRFRHNSMQPIPGCFGSLAGGNRHARSISYAAFSVLAFLIVHLVMVLVSGVWNNLRSIVTGCYDIGGRHG